MFQVFGFALRFVSEGQKTAANRISHCANGNVLQGRKVEWRGARSAFLASETRPFMQIGTVLSPLWHCRSVDAALYDIACDATNLRSRSIIRLHEIVDLAERASMPLRQRAD